MSTDPKDTKQEDAEPASESDTSSSADSENEITLLDDTSIYETKPMVTGKSKSALLHVVHDEGAESERVIAICGRIPFRRSAEFCMAYEAKSSNNRFCTECLLSWPNDMIKHLTK